MTPAIDSVVATISGLDGVRQDVPEDDPVVADADGPRRFDEDLGAERQEETSDEARQTGPAEQRRTRR